MNSLPDGLIFQIALDAELELRGKGEKRTLRCPLHEDRHASAFLSAANVFYCSVCTPGRGLSARDFCHALRLDWSQYVANGFVRSSQRSVRPSKPSKPKPVFTAAEAALVWGQARERARGRWRIDKDRAVYDYLASRGLMKSWEHAAFGVLGPGMLLPPAVRNWPRRGYRVIAPLYDSTGTIANVQARAIVPRERKVDLPRGSVAKGNVFACSRGLELLRGERMGVAASIYAEGLTDYLALSFTSPVPVIASPGTNVAADGIGPWVKGIDLLLALDCDEAAQKVLMDVARAAFEHGVRRVRRVVWPRRAKDACDALTLLGAEGLSDFLRLQLDEVTSEQ